MDVQDILAKLISFPTVSDQDIRPLIRWSAEFLKELGGEVEIIDGEQEGKAALWCRLGPAVDGGMVLAGHVDVVPVAGQPWTKPPFVMTEEGGNLYGRGSCDMKGFVAAAMAAASGADISKLVKPVYIALTYDEEVNMSGARRLVSWLKERNVRADWVWLGEPTELEVVTAHKGTGSVKTVVKGHAAHSSLPHKGVSANEALIKIGSWLMQKAEKFASKPVIGSPFDPPFSSINIGIISGGKAANIISDHAEITWQYRLHPGDDAEVLMKEYRSVIDEQVRPMLDVFPNTSVKTEAEIGIPPFQSVISSEAEMFLISITGSGVGLSVSYATEAGYFQEIAQTVLICGPGSITKAHQPDEYVPTSDLKQCVDLIDKGITTFLCKAV